mgnify:CR=1 FL=1
MTNPIKTAPPQEPGVRIIPKVWITKYALTGGVLTAENAECNAQYGGSMITFRQQGVFSTVHIHKPHWHETEAEACAQVAKMIAAAKKSLAKLDSYHFSTKPWAQ